MLADEVDLSGASLAFKGSGTINLQNEKVELALKARGSRLAATEPSVLQSLPESLSPAVVRIDVTGSLHDPQVKTTTLPVIREGFGILGTKRTKTH